MAFGGRSQLKMSEETFDFVCTTCAEDNKTLEAVKYCVECSSYCCQSCTDAHKFPALRSHNLLDVGQGKQASVKPSRLPEFPTERCSKHAGKVVDMYCEGHDVVGCSTCFVKDHKLCQDSHIHSIPDMIDIIFKMYDCKQTQRLLKGMVVSMETVSKSKDIQLQSLNKAKKEALDRLTTFQKALEAIVKKAAESSRQEVEAAYKELENGILFEKLNAENIRENLQNSDEKINQSEANRAQRFVCTKIAEEKLKDAKRENIKQALQHVIDVQISFIPDQSLMDYIKALQGIGLVQKQGQQKEDLYKKQEEDLYKKQKHNLYKITGSRNFTTKLSDDSRGCDSIGCCLTPDNQLLVTDYKNKKLKRFNIQNMTVVDYCSLDSQPHGVCCISKHEVAVACVSDKKIQFVSIQGKMSPTRQFKTSHQCFGIASKDGKLYVTNSAASLYMYDMTGTLLKTISQDNAGNKLFHCSRHVTFNESGTIMFVGGGNNGLVCFDVLGNYLSTITSYSLSYADGVCVDGRGNVFVVGAHNVVQFNENGNEVGVVVEIGHRLHDPVSVCFHQGLKRMFVTLENSDALKMYELE